MITVPGARVFVAEALIGEQVACVRLAQQLLVIYRTMYVREIDLKTGRTRSLLRPVDAAGPVDAKNAPTGPWKTHRTRFPQRPQA
jgi:hypothetical protein